MILTILQTEAATKGVLQKKKVFQNFRKIHGKAPVTESLF